MRGWRMDTLGEPNDVLRLEELPDPTPGAGQVVIDVEAAGVNFPDLLVIRGDYQWHPPLPSTPGSELIGHVHAVGANTAVPVGGRVTGLACPPYGAFAERAVCNEIDITPIPEELPAAGAVALQANYVTSYLALIHRAQVRAGEVVLVLGGAGGVGSAAIQIALARGARVIGCDFGPRRRRFCHELGAELAVDPGVEDLVAAVNDFTAGRGADIVIDTVGGDVFDESRRCIAFEGRIVVVGFTSGRIPELQVNRLILRNFTVMGVNAMAYQLEYPHIHGHVRQEVIDLCLRGQISPAIHGEFKLDELPAVFAQLDRGEVLGKALIRPAPPAIG